MNLFYENITQRPSSYPVVYLPQPPIDPGQEIHSLGFLIHETIFLTLAEREPLFKDYKAKRRTKADPVQANQLPYLGVYMGREDMGPDGDPNATDIRFSHTLPITISVILANNNQDDVNRLLDQAYNRIMQRIFRDAWIVNVLRTVNPWSHLVNAGDVKIESIVRGRKDILFGLPGGNNETPMAEMRYTMTVAYRSTWDPVF